MFIMCNQLSYLHSYNDTSLCFFLRAVAILLNFTTIPEFNVAEANCRIGIPLMNSY